MDCLMQDDNCPRLPQYNGRIPSGYGNSSFPDTKYPSNNFQVLSQYENENTADNMAIKAHPFTLVAFVLLIYTYSVFEVIFCIIHWQPPSLKSNRVFISHR